MFTDSFLLANQSNVMWFIFLKLLNWIYFLWTPWMEGTSRQKGIRSHQKPYTNMGTNKKGAPKVWVHQSPSKSQKSYPATLNLKTGPPPQMSCGSWIVLYTISSARECYSHFTTIAKVSVTRRQYVQVWVLQDFPLSPSDIFFAVGYLHCMRLHSSWVCIWSCLMWAASDVWCMPKSLQIIIQFFLCIVLHPVN